MGMTVYRVLVKDVEGNELYSKEVKISSLVAFVLLGVQLFKLRKNEKVPAFCSIERVQLG